MTELTGRSFGEVNVLGVGVHAIDLQRARLVIAAKLQTGTKGYVCLTGVHGVMEARRDPTLKTTFAEAILVAPDGMPTVWMGKLQGFSTMQRVFGPDLMIAIIGGAEFRNCRHFFCGGEPGVAEHLREGMMRRFPWVRIVGTWSPPFRSMTSMEERELATKVKLLQPDIIWVGLSTPKQERFMARYLPTLHTKLMIGVGAAFLFHTGAIQDSPKWVKRAGLQWLHRLIQEPSRLWRRYLRNNFFFVVHVLLQVAGFGNYALEPGSERRCPQQILDRQAQ